MKRFLIPALFVVHAGSEMEALGIASIMQSGANRAAQITRDPTNHLFLDEKLPSREVPINPEETELPRTYKL